MDFIDLKPGTVINRRFRVMGTIGEGNCGTVYRVVDVDSKRKKVYALKTEAKMEDANNELLKKEADVLKKLEERKHVPRLIHCGRRDQYNYFVMTLCGKSLQDLQKNCKLDTFTAGTASKAGIHVLYGIKQIHEIGYIHRDIKPANLVVGRTKKTSRVIYVIDYGMARRFAIWENGKVRHRQPRGEALFRGSPRFCSPFVHQKTEQSRRDDMWSFMYSLISLHKGYLPWQGKKPDEIPKIKESTKDEVLYEKCPPEWLKIQRHIRTLEYETRPDYKLIYDELKAVMEKANTTFADPYDWEKVNKSNRTQSSANEEQSTEHNDGRLKSRNSKLIKSSEGTEDGSESGTTSPAAFESNDIGI